jgi:hypothetical protein
MMMDYAASDYREWSEAGLKDFTQYSDCITYCNQLEYGDEQLEGKWWYADKEHLTIYWGSFGNYNSPGASHHTYANIYDDREEFLVETGWWESLPEFLEEDEDEECEEDIKDEDWIDVEKEDYEDEDYWEDNYKRG